MARLSTFLSCIVLLFTLGCSQGPKAIPALHVNAKAASSRALELHVTNSDGKLDSDELVAAPGLDYAAELSLIHI